MKERILIPLDGSRVGEAALPYVEDLVSKLSPGVKVEVTLLQVIPPTHDVIAGEASAKIPYTEKETGQIKELATAYLEKAGKILESKKVAVQYRVEVGKAADEIIKTADEIKVDMIAMSTHGRSGFSRLAFGSVTESVLRGGNVPVLTVKATGGAGPS